MKGLSLSETTIGSITMMILLFLSGYFFLERMTQMDSAFTTVTLINEQQFILPHNRYPLVFTQILPLLMIYFTLPIKGVLFAYSISFYLFYAFAFLLCLRRYKQETLALLIPLICIVNSSELFFIQTEILHGLICCITWVASYRSSQKHPSAWGYAETFIWAICSILFHPISCIMLGYAVFFEWGVQKKIALIFLSTFGFIVIWVLVKQFVFPINAYENQFYTNTSMDNFSFTSIFKSYTLAFYLKRFASLYLVINITILFCVLIYFFNKAYKKLILFVAAIIGYLLLVIMMFKGDSDVMMERVFLGLAFITLLNVTDALSNPSIMSNPIIRNGFWLFLVIGGMVNITKAIPRQTEHLKLSIDLSNRLQAIEGHKIYAYSKDIPFAKNYTMWPIAAEQLLISAVYHSNNIKTLYLFDSQAQYDEQLAYKTDSTYILVAPFYFQIQQAGFNSHYFNLPLEPYKYAKLY